MQKRRQRPPTEPSVDTWRDGSGDPKIPDQEGKSNASHCPGPRDLEPESKTGFCSRGPCKPSLGPSGLFIAASRSLPAYTTES